MDLNKISFLRGLQTQVMELSEYPTSLKVGLAIIYIAPCFTVGTMSAYYERSNKGNKKFWKAKKWWMEMLGAFLATNIGAILALVG